MEEFVSKLKKIPVPILVVISLLVILILVQVSGITNIKKQKNEEKFEFQVEKQKNVYELIKNLENQLQETRKQLNSLENKKISNNINKLQNRKIKELINKYGKIIDKKELPDGSILITTADGKKFRVLPDGTIIPLNDYKLDKNGNIILTDKNGKESKLLLNKKDKVLKDLINKHGKILEKHILPDGSMIIRTADGRMFKINPDGTMEELKDFKVNPDGSITYTTNDGKIHKLNKVFKNVKLKDNPIIEVLDSNGNRYVKGKDGNWYKITPDGKRILVGKDLKIDKDGNIIIDGKNMGKAVAITKANGMVTDDKGNIYYEKKDNVKTKKLSGQEAVLKDLKNKHGGILEEHILPDGSRIIRTADGRMFKINPDGSIEELKDFKINPDGTITYTTNDGKTITSKLSPQEGTLNKLEKKYGAILEKHILPDGSMIIRTADGRMFKINPDGTMEELKDFKVNPDGSITYTTKKDKTVIVKQDLNGNTTIIGEGKIITDKNGKNILVLQKIYKINLGKPVLNCLSNKDYYEEIDGNIYKNYKLLGKGGIFYKNKSIVIKFKNNKIFLNNIKTYTLKDLYFVNKNENIIYQILPNKTLYKYNLSLNTIKTFNNIDYEVKDNKLVIKQNNIVIDNIDLSPNQIRPNILTIKGNLINRYYNYIHVFNKKTLPFMFTTFKSLNDLKIKENNYLLNNNNQYQYILNYQKKLVSKIYKNYKMTLNGLVFDNHKIYKKQILGKELAEGLGFINNNFNSIFYKNNLFIGDNSNYSLISNVDYKIEDKNLLVKHKYQNINFGNVITLSKTYILKDKGMVVPSFNNYNYITKRYTYTNIGQGNIVIKNGNVYLKDKNGKLHLLGSLSTQKYNNIKNGEIIEQHITKHEVNLMNAIKNKNWIFVNYGQQIELTNNDRYFFNDKLELIKISGFSKVQNLGISKLLVNIKTKEAFLIKEGVSKYLGLVSNIKVKDSTIYQTTTGMYYVLNNKLYLLKNEKFKDLQLVPFVASNVLYGIDLAKREKYNFGIILSTLTGDLKNPSILNGKDLNNMAEINNGNIYLGNKFVIKSDNKVYRLVDNKELFYGLYIGKTPKNYYIIKNNITGVNEIYDQNGNKVEIYKNKDGSFTAKVNNKKINISIKQKGKNLEIDGIQVSNVLFDNSYLYNNRNNVKMVNNQDLENLFNKEMKLKPKLRVKKTENKNYNTFNKPFIDPYKKIKVKMVVLSSNEALKKNIGIFKTNNTPETKYMLDNGNVVSNLNEFTNGKKSYFIPLGTKIYATLAGGSIAPLMVGTSSSGGNKGINEFIKNNNISFFIVEKNIILADGSEVPLKGAKITATPIATTLQRVVYNLKSLNFYDEGNNKWFYSNKISGSVMSEKDLVAGLPAVLVDYRDKYMAKATIYSILQGITQYLVATKSPIAAVDNMASSSGGAAPDLGGTLGQTVLGGASNQMKNINDLMLAILKSQIPYLVVKTGEPVIIRLNDNLIIKNLQL